MLSSFAAHLKILLMLVRLIPMLICRVHLYLSNPSALRSTKTRETWELSMAWSWMPVSAQSHVASVRRSFRDSSTFLRRLPCTRRASNILWMVNNLEGDTDVHNEIE